MYPPFKTNADTNVAKKGLDLQNKMINLMNQGAPAASVGTRQDLQVSSIFMCDIQMLLNWYAIDSSHRLKKKIFNIPLKLKCLNFIFHLYLLKLPRKNILKL